MGAVHGPGTELSADVQEHLISPGRHPIEEGIDGLIVLKLVEADLGLEG